MSYLRLATPTFFPDGINHLAARGWSKASDLTIQSGTVDNKYLLCDQSPWDVATFAVSGTSDAIIIEVDRTGYEYFPVNFALALNTNFVAAGGTGGSIRYSSTPITTSTSGTALAGESWKLSADPEIMLHSATAETSERYVALVLTPSGNWSADVTIGQVLLGKSYGMPVSGDLTVKTGFRLEGVKLLESDYGRRYGQANWVTGYHADHMPFRTQNAARVPAGRQYYQVQFSYIDDTDLIPADLEDISGGSNLFELVFQKTVGELLPLVFCGNGVSTSKTDYMYGRIRADGFHLEQIAYRVYRITLTVEQEV